jgi:hypothetical protein
MVFLPLGKSVLPMVMMESTKACNAIDAKVYHDGICILLGKVAEMAEHLRHGLAMWGLRLVELAHPSIIWVLGLFVLGFPHFGVRGFIVLILILVIIITILWWITITASWWRDWPLTGGRRISLILTLIVIFSFVRAVGSAPLDGARVATLGGASSKG